MGEGHHPSLSERRMREGWVDLIRERESCVKNEFVRHHRHDSGRRKETAETWSHGRRIEVKDDRKRKKVTSQGNDC